jgi:hypothetical protein
MPLKDINCSFWYHPRVHPIMTINPMLKRNLATQMQTNSLVTVDLGLVWTRDGETEVFGLDFGEFSQFDIDVVEM